MSSGFDKEVSDVLKEELTVYHRRGAGGTYPYHKGEDVIRQLNRAFQHAWSSRVLRAEEQHGQILVQVAVAVRADGWEVVHEGFGGAQIAKERSSGEVIDIGNAYKSAFTNALKKAAEQFGIGLGEGEEDGVAVAQPTAPAPARAPAPQPARPAPAQTPPRQPSAAARPAAPTAPRTGSGSTQPRPTSSSFRPTPQNRPPAPAAPTSGEPASSGSPPPAWQNAVSSDEPVNSAQISAMRSLSGMRKLDELQMIQGALPGTTKTTIEELTKREAVAVIRHTSSLPVNKD